MQVKTNQEVVAGAMRTNVLVLSGGEFPAKDEVWEAARKGNLLDENEKFWLRDGEDGMFFYFDEFELEDHLGRRRPRRRR